MDQELLLERGWVIFHWKIGEVEESYNLFLLYSFKEYKKDYWKISSSSKNCKVRKQNTNESHLKKYRSFKLDFHMDNFTFHNL